MAADTQHPDEATTMPIRRPLYEGSTQFRRWRFSVEQLSDMRGTLNKTAVAAIRNAFEADSAGSFFASTFTW